ncbi:MAG: glycosyltransferase family 2 protein [Calditrichaeota bacterium]|nr:glycosyltransferase family 2 protein [Calditrichota bacterium]
MPEKNKYGIAIPSYNGCNALEICLQSIERWLGSHKDLAEIAVVDDGSTDGTREKIPDRFPFVRWIWQEENRGFCHSANRAIAECNADIVVLLNNDIELTSDILSPLSDYFSNPETFAVSFRSFQNDGRTFREGAKQLVWRQGFPFVLHAERHQPEAIDGRIRSAYAVGGHAAFRRVMFCALGGFDSLFHPFYWEDVDLGVRARERGWEIYCEPDCCVIHHFGGTIQSSFSASDIAAIKARNRLLFAWRHRRGLVRAIHRLFLTGRILSSWAVGDWAFYRGLKLALTRRHLVRKFPEPIAKASQRDS